MTRGLFLRRENFGNFAVSPFGDVVVLSLHAVYPALNLVPVVLDQEDDAVEVLPDNCRQLLSRELE
jgi:hypothetical protein